MAATTSNGLNLALAATVIGIIFLFNFASAQTTSTPTAAPTTAPTTASVLSSTPPSSQNQISESCQEATAKSVNLTLFHGEWFEVARKIQNSSNNESCNAWNFINETNPLTLVSTYSTNPDKLWANQSTTGVEINLTNGVYSLNNTDGTVNFFKILDTDYNTFAFICSYKNSTTNRTETHTTTSASTSTPAPTTTTTTNPNSTTSSPSDTTTAPSPSKNSTADAYIFVRHRSTAAYSTLLANLTALAESKYSDFDNLTTVIQSDKCTGGASVLMPMLTMIMTVVLAAIYKL